MCGWAGVHDMRVGQVRVRVRVRVSVLVGVCARSVLIARLGAL